MAVSILNISDIGQVQFARFNFSAAENALSDGRPVAPLPPESFSSPTSPYFSYVFRHRLRDWSGFSFPIIARSNPWSMNIRVGVP